VNIPPQAIALSDIVTGTPPMRVEFSANTSTDLDGSITSYQWDFGDGFTDNSQNPVYTYDIAGKYYAVLTVTDNDGVTDKDTLVLYNNPDLSRLYISEVSYAETASGEYVELYNNAPYSINLNEFKLIKINDQGITESVFDFGRDERWASTTIIPSKQFLIIGKDVTIEAFTDHWEISPQYLSYNSGSYDLVSGAEGHRWQLRYYDGTVNQNDGTIIEDTEEIVAEFRRRSYQESDGSWRHTSYSFATPGYMDADQSLAVELMALKTTAAENSIILNWETKCEINNLGFKILRSTEEDGTYRLIASYENDPDLHGQGNSPTEIRYSYTDFEIEKNITYWYKLIDVDYAGKETVHGPVHGILLFLTNNILQMNIDDIPEKFMIHNNYPNPFNSSTSILVDIPEIQNSNPHVNINIYNILGTRVRQLYQGPLLPGRYQLQWDSKNDTGNELASGVYILSLQSTSFAASKKMILMR
jgi:PKD repeat protein